MKENAAPATALRGEVLLPLHCLFRRCAQMLSSLFPGEYKFGREVQQSFHLPEYCFHAILHHLQRTGGYFNGYREDFKTLRCLYAVTVEVYGKYNMCLAIIKCPKC